MQSAGMVFGRTNATVGIFLTFFIARERRIEYVNAFQAAKALRNCSMSLETITPVIGISINPLYSSDSFMSIL